MAWPRLSLGVESHSDASASANDRHEVVTWWSSQDVGVGGALVGPGTRNLPLLRA